jgi:hypothetical protein
MRLRTRAGPDGGGGVENNLASIWVDLGLESGSTVAYRCGNPDMVDRSREVLVSLGAPRDAVIHENYWPSTDKPPATRRPGSDCGPRPA